MEKSIKIETDNKFHYLKNLIKKLARDDEFVLLVFLLKCQYIEYGLKYLLGWYPFKPANYYKSNFFDKATTGMVIKKLEGLNDNYLREITEEANKFLNIRNEFTHNLLTSDKSTAEIEQECLEKLKTAGEIEAKIHMLIDYVDDLVYGSFH